MRKVILAIGVALAITATAAAAPICPDLGLPPSTGVVFNGVGGFDQDTAPTLDINGYANGIVAGTELFGVANILNITEIATAAVLYVPSANGMELTMSFFDAIANSDSSFTDNGDGTRTINLTYQDGARLIIVADSSPDYNISGGSGAFDTATGDYPTVYTIPAGGAPLDTDEVVFLDLLLSNNRSSLTFDITGAIPASQASGMFTSRNVTILGGCGALQFQDALKADGNVLNINIPDTTSNWLYNAQTSLQMITVPAPPALFSLLAGLALMGGYKLRRK